MSAASSLSSTPRGAAGASGPQPATRRRRVIDAPTRMFHGLFALSFAGAWITGDGEHWRLLHVTLGYVLAGLLVFRLVYGVVGPQPARLSVLWRKLTQLPSWLRGLAGVDGSGCPGILRTSSWLQGQAPLMGLAIAALLLGVVPLTLSGYAAYQAWGGEWLEEVHEVFGNLLLLVVLAHLALIAGLSVLRRRNLAAPMVTGRVDGAGPDLVKHNRAWLAAALLGATLAFGYWQWQQAPAQDPQRTAVGGQPDAARPHGDRDDEDD